MACSRDGCNVYVSPRDTTIEDVILTDAFSERIERSINDAKKKILKKDSVPTVEIMSEKGTSLVIDEALTPSGKEYFVIYRHQDSKNTPLIKIRKDRFRYVYLSDLVDCRIFVKCKLLRIMFDRCEGCQISIRTPIIGLTEFYKCNNIVVAFRICDTLYPSGTSPLPLISIEDCQKIQILQSVELLMFLVKLSVDVTGTIVDEKSGQRLQSHDMGKIIWDETEQSLISLSREQGFVSSSVEGTHHFNSISHTFLSDSPAGDHHPFGTTPPVDRSWMRNIR